MLAAYDPMTHGTPLALLQVPATALQEISKKLADGKANVARFSQDGKTLADLKSIVSEQDHACAQTNDVEVGFVCKKCHLVYPAEALCFNHQRSICFPNKNPSELAAVLRLVQIQYQCKLCKDGEGAGSGAAQDMASYATHEEYKYHCALESHADRLKAQASTIMKNTAAASDANAKHDSDNASTSSPLSNVDSKAGGATSSTNATSGREATPPLEAKPHGVLKEN